MKVPKEKLSPGKYYAHIKVSIDGKEYESTQEFQITELNRVELP